MKYFAKALCTGLAMLLVAGGSQANASSFWVAANDGKIGTVDIATRVFTLKGTVTGVGSVTDIAWLGTDLYILGNNGNTLHRVNTINFSTTLLASGLPSLSSLVADPTHTTLFGGGNNVLRQFSATGSTLNTYSPTGAASGGDLEFAPDPNNSGATTLFMTTVGASYNPTALVKFTPAFTAVTVGPNSDNVVVSLAYVDGVMYGISAPFSSTQNFLVTVNLATGATTNLGALINGPTARIWGASANPIPEPAFFQMGTLIAFGGLGFMRLRKRS